MLFTYLCGQLLEGFKHALQILAWLQGADHQKEAWCEAMRGEHSVALGGANALEIHRLHAQRRDADTLWRDAQMANHVLLAVFGDGDDVIGTLDAGSEQPAFQALEVLLDPFRVQHRNHVHDRGDDRYTFDPRDMVVRGMEQLDIFGDACRTTQWQFEDATEHSMNTVVAGQLLRLTTGQHWQVPAESIRFDVNIFSLTQLGQTVPERP